MSRKYIPTFESYINNLNESKINESELYAVISRYIVDDEGDEEDWEPIDVNMDRKGASVLQKKMSKIDPLSKFKVVSHKELKKMIRDEGLDIGEFNLNESNINESDDVTVFGGLDAEIRDQFEEYYRKTNNSSDYRDLLSTWQYAAKQVTVEEDKPYVYVKMGRGKSYKMFTFKNKKLIKIDVVTDRVGNKTYDSFDDLINGKPSKDIKYKKESVIKGLDKKILNQVKEYYEIQNLEWRFKELLKDTSLKHEVDEDNPYTVVRIHNGQGYTTLKFKNKKLTRIEEDDPSGRRTWDSLEDYSNNKMSGGRAYKSY